MHERETDLSPLEQRYLKTNDSRIAQLEQLRAFLQENPTIRTEGRVAR